VEMECLGSDLGFDVELASQFNFTKSHINPNNKSQVILISMVYLDFRMPDCRY